MTCKVLSIGPDHTRQLCTPYFIEVWARDGVLERERDTVVRESVDVCNSQTHFDSATQAIKDVICTDQRPVACEIDWVDTVDGGRRRRLGDRTTMTYVITITQDVSSDVSMNAATTFLTAATINAALRGNNNDNVVIATEPVQGQAALSLTITTTAKGSTCVKGNEGVMCAVCKSLGGLSRCSEVHVTHAARSPLATRRLFGLLSRWRIFSMRAVRRRVMGDALCVPSTCWHDHRAGRLYHD